MGKRWVFDGHIAGIGTESGLRAVVGLWQQSPFGPFADAMVELPSGHRVLLAPTAEIGEFIAAVYNFDETQVLDVAASHGARRLRVDAGPLRIRAAVGGRTRLGGAVRLIPRPVAVHPLWLRAVNPLAARLSPGARTAGAAKGGRQEYYGVTDLHRIDAADVDWNGAGAGALAAIRPAVTFGFSSVPPAPSLARVRTTVVQSKAGGKQSPHKLPRPASDFARTERSIRIAPGGRMTGPDTGVAPREEAFGFAQRRSWVFSAWWYSAVLAVSGAVYAGLAA